MTKPLREGKPIRIFIAKAQPISQTCPVPDYTIALCVKDLEFATLEEARIYYAKEAEMLESALNNALPGDTYHALLVRMLERKVSLLQGPN
jgi:hypothetical protein